MNSLPLYLTEEQLIEHERQSFNFTMTENTWNKYYISKKKFVSFLNCFTIFHPHLQCLLVKGWKGTSWSFPRGKKNKDEEDHNCAIREVCKTFFLYSKALPWVVVEVLFWNTWMTDYAFLYMDIYFRIFQL